MCDQIASMSTDPYKERILGVRNYKKLLQKPLTNLISQSLENKGLNWKFLTQQDKNHMGMGLLAIFRYSDKNWDESRKMIVCNEFVQ